MIARPYQNAAHDAVFHEWGIADRYQMRLNPRHLPRFCPTLPTTGAPVRGTVLDLATGAGKTNIAGLVIETVIKDPSAKIIFIADTDELCRQPMDRFQSMGIYAALEKAEHRASLQAQVVVASAQTLSRRSRRQRFAAGHFRIGLVDEAHRGSGRNKEIIDDLAPEFYGGFTGTAFRSGEADLSKYFDSVCFQLGPFDLIGHGYAVPFRVKTLPVRIDLTNVHSRGGDYIDTELDSAITPYYEAICEALMREAKDHYTVTFSTLVKSSTLFAQICRHHGLTAQHIDGGSEDRAEILRNFGEGKFRNLCNAALLSTGWDCPICSCLCNLRPTRSSSLFRQMVGRILRILPGVIDGLTTAEARKAAIAASAKPEALILDFLWDVPKHGIQGPASLIDDGEAEESGKSKLRQGKTDEELAEIAAEVQLDMETRLRARLDWAAQQQMGLFDAAVFAALSNNSALQNYKPKNRREGSGLNKFTRELLENNGIDPATVTCYGHAQRILQAINRRKHIGALPLRTVARTSYSEARRMLAEEENRIRKALEGK